MENSEPDTLGAHYKIACGDDDELLVYGDTNMFLFLRFVLLASAHTHLLHEFQLHSVFAFARMFSLHRFIYERLLIAKKLCSTPHNTPIKQIKHAIEGKHDEEEDTKEETEDELDNFTQFLSTLHAIVEGTCDNSRFEEHCRYVSNVCCVQGSYLSLIVFCIFSELSQLVFTIIKELDGNREFPFAQYRETDCTGLCS